MLNHLNNKYGAEKVAVVEKKYHIAERRLRKYIEHPDTSIINKYLAYNELIQYTYMESLTNIDYLDICLKYCYEQIQLLPRLTEIFSRFNYDFEEEYIVGIEVAIKIYQFKKDHDGIMKFSDYILKTIDNKDKQNSIANSISLIMRNDFNDNIKLEDIEDIFKYHSSLMTKKMEETKNNNENKSNQNKKDLNSKDLKSKSKKNGFFKKIFKSTRND